MIQAKALQFNSSIRGQNDFRASNGWLRNFKETYGIRSVSIRGEKLSANTSSVDPFKSAFLNYIEKEQLGVDQVFNCDESGLNYEVLSETTLSAKTEKSPSGLKGYKERITVMACCNVSGTLKLPLVVIGKAKKPRAFKGVKSLPVSYKSQANAWMNGDLFASWFHEEFVPTVKAFLTAANLPVKALLTMDNCACHYAGTNVDGIHVMFFPPNTTSLIQPMDQGCLQTLKLLYKKHLMNYVLDSIENDMTLIDTVKKITIKDAIDWLTLAWNDVFMSTIQKSWNNVWPWETRREICETHIKQREHVVNLLNQFRSVLNSLPTYCDVGPEFFEEWLHSRYLTADECISERDIINIVSRNTNEEEASESDENNNSNNNFYHENDDEENLFMNTITDKTVVQIDPCDEEDVSQSDAMLYISLLHRFCAKNNCQKVLKR